MVDLSKSQLIKLARELVMNIRDYQLTFADFGIDETSYQLIEKNEFFRKVKEQFTLEWNAAISTEERLRIGSLAYCEQLAPVVTRRAMLPDSNLGASTDVLKALAKMAGIGEVKNEKGTAERFVISIDLGGDVQVFNKSIDVNPNDVAPNPTELSDLALPDKPQRTATAEEIAQDRALSARIKFLINDEEN